MKYLFFTIFLSLTFSSSGQNKVYEKTYCNENLCLYLLPDGTFKLYTAWEEYEDDPGTVRTWGNGQVSYKKDTLICTDAITNKKVYLIKEANDDMIRIVNWEDYKDRSDENNAVWRYKGDCSSFIFLDEFLMKNNLLLIRSITERISGSKETKCLKIFSWKSGVKTLILEKYY